MELSSTAVTLMSPVAESVVAGPAESVMDDVRHLVRIFKKNGGFVFTQVHNIMGDVPPENIVAMLDTAYEESFYDTQVAKGIY